MTTCDEVCDTVTCQLTLNVVMTVSCLRLARWQILTLIVISITFLNLYSNVISTSNKVSRIQCECAKKRTMPEITRDEAEYLAKGILYPSLYSLLRKYNIIDQGENVYVIVNDETK